MNKCPFREWQISLQGRKRVGQIGGREGPAGPSSGGGGGGGSDGGGGGGGRGGQGGGQATDDDLEEVAL